MEGTGSVADSHAWEEECKQLLAIRHGDELQLIDASRAGDFGLEAFTRDGGLGFQCYAPLEPLSAKDRYEKHRDKLTTDLNKLVSNEDALRAILGTTKLTRYVFMVPQFGPDLLNHCGKKAEEMRGKDLSILDPAFDIVVHTSQSYPAERAQLVELALKPLQLNIPEVEEARRTDWATENAPLVETLTGKIGKFALDQERQEALRDQFLNHYLRREQLLDQVLNEAPDTHARLTRRIREREHLLATARLMAMQPPLEHANTVIHDLTHELLEESKALQGPSAEELAYGTAADWLIRCPLDF